MVVLVEVTVSELTVPLEKELDEKVIPDMAYAILYSVVPSISYR